MTFNVSPAGTTGNIAFSSGPAIDPATGNLTYTTSADTNGTATFNVTLSDNGSNLPPNSNTSGTQQFTITVNAINDAPTFTLGAGPTVDEDAGAQTVAGFASGFQPGPAAATDEAGQTLVGYNVSVTGTTGSLSFTSAPAIDNAGQLTFTAAANTSGTATVSVTATDSGSNVPPNVNTSAAQQFTITVNAVNDPPSFTLAGNPAAVNEDAGAQTVPGFASAISQGAGETGQTLTFNVSPAGTTGNIAFSSGPAIDPATGNLTYTASPDTNGTATFNVTLSDNGSNVPPNSNTSGTQQFTITVNAVNDAPSFQIPSNPPAVNEDAGAQTVAGFATNFQPGPAAATDEAGQTLVGYTVTQTGSTGNLSFSAGPAIDNAGQLTYTPSNNTSGTATFSVVATDSGSGVAPNVNQSAPLSFTITVNGQNDAPVLDNAGNMTLAAINEDVPNASNPGTLVSDIIASAGGDRITDNDAGAVEGIAVFTVDNTNGTWEFSINNGVNWTAFGTPDATTARLLAADAQTRIRFIPAANFNGLVDPGVTFRAWDQTSGTNGGTADVSGGGGGTTAFSVATETASITVNAQNDNPTTTGLANVNVNEDAPDTVIDLRLSFNDVEDLPAGLVYTVQSNSNPALFTSTNINNANDNLTLDYAPNVSGVANITIRATDTGGLFVESTFTVTVNAVADTPSVTNATTTVNTQTTSGLVITRNAADGAEVTHFKITNIQNGTLFQADGVTAIANGSFITAAQGLAGLKFTPALNFNGTANFDIQASTSAVDAGLGGSVITANITVGCGPTVVTNNGNSGDGSLRTVVLQACAGATITFDMATVTSPITLTSGEILIDKNLTITGPGANQLTISGNNASRVFRVDVGNTVSISGLLITNGNAIPGGGGVTNFGNLTLNAVTVTNSTATGGGGIHNGGTLTITNSTLSSNTATGNSGGAIFNTGTLNIANSTISGNSTANDGGGIFNNAGTLTVTNATITGNRADSDGNGTGTGGGIAANGTEILNNTIVAGNFRGLSPSTTPDDLSGSINSANFNLIGDAATSGGISHGVGGNRVGNTGVGTININTVLNTTLASNGGPTQTHALVGGSLAIDQAANGLAPATDQRGVTRPFDGNGDGTATADIGAFELDNSIPTTTGIANVTVAENAADTVINLFPSFADVETPDASLVYTVEGNTNAALFTNVSIAGGNLTLDYATGAVGTANITVRATDAGGAFVETTFTVTVLEGGTLQFNSATYNVNENGGNAVITITRAGGSAGATSVLFQTSNGTAGAGDYTTVSQTVNFADGQTSQTINVPITNDAVDEPNETVNLTLSNVTGSGALGAPAAAVLTITDDEPTPSISISDVSQAEGDSGTTNFVFTVTLSNPSSQTVTVNFATANGTATAPADYASNAGVVTFNPLETTQTITVAVVGNVLFEPNETFFVNLSGAANATIADNQGLGTILNDDAQGGVFQFSSATYTVGESGGQATITVNRTGDTTQAANVDFATSDDSNSNSIVTCSVVNGVANSRCDFTTAAGTLRFAAGETTKTFNVLISQDSFVEGAETLTLTLTHPTNGGVLGVPANSTLTITDDATEPATNIIDNAGEFVRMHYHDFLNREPDAAGLAFWTNNITKCNDPAQRPAGQTLEQCIDKQREATSSAFFVSPEFQATGGFVYRLYKGSLPGVPNYDNASQGRFPTFLEFIRDSRRVSEGIIVNGQISAAVLEANRAAFAEEFVQRPEFLAEYGGFNNTQYVDRLLQVAVLSPTPAQRQALIDGLNNATETRATVLRKVVDGTVFVSEGNIQFTTPYGQAFFEREIRRAFVMMEYFGYLRRNPDAPGFNFWLGKLNSFNGDFFQAQMVRSFIVSPEYRARFGTP